MGHLTNQFGIAVKVLGPFGPGVSVGVGVGRVRDAAGYDGYARNSSDPRSSENVLLSKSAFPPTSTNAKLAAS